MKDVIELAKESKLLNTNLNEWKGREVAYNELIAKLEHYRKLCREEYAEELLKQEPVYFEVYCEVEGWQGASKFLYDNTTPHHRRTLYANPIPQEK